MRGDRVEVWLGADDTPEALAHIRGVLMQELAGEGAEEVVRTAKYKKHFDSRQEKAKQHPAKNSAPPTPGTGPSPNGPNGLASPMTPKTSSSGHSSEIQPSEAFAQQQQVRGRERERERERERGGSKEQERIMQLGRERLEKERAEKERLRDERVRAMAAAAVAATEAKHQQQLKEQRERQAQ